ncbi:hypothetical protein T492DRAFT_53147 [Pavlovales sp. CCMP2436]|nr:hypothetical protein T492DRAFT_53147 [Pavlovales sp. CCMP2436]
MAVSSCDKGVATRLFRMLAVSELDASAVKADSASYAKLSLLTQQANLLQRQAVQVVNKTAVTADMAGADSHVKHCTALAEYDDGTKHLLSVLAVNDRTVAAIRRDVGASAKLSLLADQVGLLQEQAREVFADADLNRRLTAISARSVTRLVPGTVYYHYTQNGREALSRVAAHEWSNYDAFHGKYIYDFDFCFRKVDEDRQPAAWDAPLALIACAMELVGPEDAVPEPPRVMDMISDIATAHKLKPVCDVLSRWS